VAGWETYPSAPGRPPRVLHWRSLLGSLEPGRRRRRDTSTKEGTSTNTAASQWWALLGPVRGERPWRFRGARLALSQAATSAHQLAGLLHPEPKNLRCDLRGAGGCWSTADERLVRKACVARGAGSLCALVVGGKLARELSENLENCKCEGRDNRSGRANDEQRYDVDGNRQENPHSPIIPVLGRFAVCSWQVRWVPVSYVTHVTDYFVQCRGGGISDRPSPPFGPALPLVIWNTSRVAGQSRRRRWPPPSLATAPPPEVPWSSLASRIKPAGNPPPKDPGGVSNGGPSSLHSVQRRPDAPYAIFLDEAQLPECLNVMKMKP